MSRVSISVRDPSTVADRPGEPTRLYPAYKATRLSTGGACASRIRTRIASLGRLDVAVVNAAIARVGPSLLDTPKEDLDEQLRVNVVGPLIAMREAARRMAEAGEGLIINVGSIFSFEVYAKMGPYCASKFALLALSRTSREEVRSKGVRVTTFCPGNMDTTILGDLVRNPASMQPPELRTHIEVGETMVNPLPQAT